MKLPAGYYSAFVGLHIEQGPMLEKKQLAIGIVTAIAVPASLRISIDGEGGHAGAVLMPDRHDAFLAAAEIALAMEAAAKASGGGDTVATTGMCDVFPGAVNSIASRVRLEVDVRDIDLKRRDAVLRETAEAAEATGARRGVTVRTETINADAPAQCAASVVDALALSCKTHHASYQRMISRAYHDSLFLSSIAPAAMLFVPSRGGFSHRPDEYSSPDAVAQGTLILAETLASLASS